MSEPTYHLSWQWLCAGVVAVVLAVGVVAHECAVTNACEAEGGRLEDGYCLYPEGTP